MDPIRTSGAALFALLLIYRNWDTLKTALGKLKHLAGPGKPGTVPDLLPAPERIQDMAAQPARLTTQQALESVLLVQRYADQERLPEVAKMIPKLMAQLVTPPAQTQAKK